MSGPTPKERIDDALWVLYQYASIDGAHHKEWVIDQVAQALLGKRYRKWVEDYGEGDDFEWPVGIAP